MHRILTLGEIASSTTRRKRQLGGKASAPATITTCAVLESRAMVMSGLARAMTELLPAENPVARTVGTWSVAFVALRARERSWILPSPDIRKNTRRVSAASPEMNGS